MSLSHSVERDLDSLLSGWLRDDGIPGASLAVVRDGDRVHATGVGSRRLATNDPATPRTLYGVGSVTKSVTALAVMQLHERGDLDVADPIADHVPFELGDDVTVHHLLTHSSGLPSLGVSEVLLARRAGLGEAGVPMGDRDDFHAHVRGAIGEVAAPPGERFFYCNTGYMLCGEVVEAIDGRPYHRYVEEEILSPLGMDRSTFLEAEFEAADDRMTPYRLDGAEPVETPLPVRDLSHPNGGLVAPVTDLANYVSFHAGDGTIDGTTLVSPESLDRMHEGHVDTPEGPYGYGWRRRSVGDRTLVGHAGSIGVASAYVGFTADREWGIALAANASPSYSLAPVGEGVLAVLDGEDPAVLPFFARRRRLERVCGRYESYRGVRTATVTERGGVLELAFDDPFGGEPVALVPTDGRIEGYRFEAHAATGTRTPVEFEVGDDGIDLYYDRLRLHRVE